MGNQKGERRGRERKKRKRAVGKQKQADARQQGFGA